MTPHFTVVVPVFNRADRLGSALCSVLEQSEQDFEIVVVDDGSTDSPEQVVAALEDPRIAIFRQDNRGGGAARNAGIDRARGTFIAFLDSDDRFLPHHLAAMRRLLDGEENMIGYAPVVVDRGQGCRFVKPPRALRPGEHMAEYLLCSRGFVPTITLVAPRRLARQVRYSDTLPFAQDTDFAIRLFLAGCKFRMAEEPGAVWIDRGDPGRVSARRRCTELQGWLEGLGPCLPARALHGGRGWMLAKALVRTRPVAALRLYVAAVMRGCYHPKLALAVFLQIFAPDSVYRRFSDCVVRILRGRIWSGEDRIAARAVTR
ncbi:MAG: glycosyltransferase family 2 protein [Rhizomicrobium sp.]